MGGYCRLTCNILVPKDAEREKTGRINRFGLKIKAELSGES